MNENRFTYKCCALFAKWFFNSLACLCGFACLSIIFSMSPAAQERDTNPEGAELNVMPLNTKNGLNSGKSIIASENKADGKPLPVPNKLDRGTVTQNENELDGEWTSGTVLQKKSIFNDHAEADKKIEALSQETKLLISLERTLKAKSPKIFTVPNVSSLFYTVRQHALLREAQAGFFNALQREKSPEAKRDQKPELSGLDLSPEYVDPEPIDQDEQPKQKNTQQKQESRTDFVRSLKLNGIIYNGPDKWIVWLNDKRITPSDKPKQIVDINVSVNHVKLRWYDGFRNKIFPVKLRPGQLFNLDSRSFSEKDGGNVL